MGSLNRITIHWTAGSLVACAHDKSCYHFLVEGSGKIIKGDKTPEDNINCNDGRYAAHCGGGNTGNIGVSMCGMYGFSNRSNSGRYQLTGIQCEATWKLVAQLCKKYNIPVDAEHVFTHYEFGKKHPNTASKGKIDIVYLPYQPQIQQDNIGDFIRNKVSWYMKHI